MARKSLVICDRCGNEIPPGPSGAPPSKQLLDKSLRNGDKDLCVKCYDAFRLFMNGEDQVGEYVFALRNGECHHHVPCGAPCSTVWKQVPRGEA